MRRRHSAPRSSRSMKTAEEVAPSAACPPPAPRPRQAPSMTSAHSSPAAWIASPRPVRRYPQADFARADDSAHRETLRLQICKSMRATPSATESLPVWQKRHRERRQPSSRRPADLHERPGNEMTTSRSRYLQFVGIRATYRINLAPEGRLPVAVLLGGARSW